MAETLRQTALPPTALEHIAFVVLAPQFAVDNGYFNALALTSIDDKVKQRVAAYDGALDRWYRDWFKPLSDSIHISALGWESVIDWIREGDPVAATALDEFYALCLKYS